MNVEIWAEGALFPEKEYIKGIFVAVYSMDGELDIPGTSQNALNAIYALNALKIVYSNIYSSLLQHAKNETKKKSENLSWPDTVKYMKKKMLLW